MVIDSQKVIARIIIIIFGSMDLPQAGARRQTENAARARRTTAITSRLFW